MKFFLQDRVQHVSTKSVGTVQEYCPDQVAYRIRWDDQQECATVAEATLQALRQAVKRSLTPPTGECKAQRTFKTVLQDKLTYALRDDPNILSYLRTRLIEHKLAQPEMLLHMHPCNKEAFTTAYLTGLPHELTKDAALIAEVAWYALGEAKKEWEGAPPFVVTADALQPPYHLLDAGQPNGAADIDTFLDRDEILAKVRAILSGMAKTSALIISSPRGSGKTQFLRRALPALADIQSVQQASTTGHVLVIYAPRILACLEKSGADLSQFWQCAIIYHAATIFSGRMVNGIHFPDTVPGSLPMATQDTFASWANGIWVTDNSCAFDELHKLCCVAFGSHQGMKTFIAVVDEAQEIAICPPPEKAVMHCRASGPPRPAGSPIAEHHNGLSYVLSNGQGFTLGAGTADNRVDEIMRVHGSFSRVNIHVERFMGPLQLSSCRLLWNKIAVLHGVPVEWTAFTPFHAAISELLLRHPRFVYLAFLRLSQDPFSDSSHYVPTLHAITDLVASYYSDIWENLVDLGADVAARVLLASHCLCFTTPGAPVPGTDTSFQALQDRGILFPWARSGSLVSYVCPLFLFLPGTRGFAMPVEFGGPRVEAAAVPSSERPVPARSALALINHSLQSIAGLRLRDLVWSVDEWLSLMAQMQRATYQGSKFETLILASLVARYRVVCPHGGSFIPLTEVYLPTDLLRESLSDLFVDLSDGIKVLDHESFSYEANLPVKCLLHNSSKRTATALWPMRSSEGEIVAALQFSLAQTPREELSRQVLFRPGTTAHVKKLLVFEFPKDEFSTSDGLQRGDVISQSLEDGRLVELSGAGSLGAAQFGMLVVLQCIARQVEPPSQADLLARIVPRIRDEAI